MDKVAGFDKAFMDAEDANIGERGADETFPRTFDLTRRKSVTNNEQYKWSTASQPQQK